MKAYSLELRERVAAAYAQPGRTVPAVAAQFSVSVSCVEKLLHRQRTTGSVAALTPQGLQAALTVSGALNGDVFAAYLEQVLGPTLVPGDVVVLDNLPAHNVAGLAEIVEARGARLLYLPPYSPDFNPIELAFSKLRTWLRTAQARTRDALEAVFQKATEWVTEADAKNWFDHCGYHIH